jgi:hypothetical protein
MGRPADPRRGGHPRVKVRESKVSVQRLRKGRDKSPISLGLRARAARRLTAPEGTSYRLLHVAARLAFHARTATLRIDHAWPWAAALVDAFTRARALPALA